MTAIPPALRAVYPPVVEAHGGYFTLADGRCLLDLSSQTLNLALGQGHSTVIRAAMEQVRMAQFASSRFGTRPFVRLSQRLTQIAPESLDAVILKLTNGSDAVETSIKLAMLHTRRHRVGCLPGAWHGESFLTLGLATTHRGRLIADDRHVVVADAPDVAALTRTVAGRHDLAAVILDPALVSNGLPVCDINGELTQLRIACDNAGTLLVFDEVQTFGWLGAYLFATEAVGVTPDVVCLGKALGCGFPLAAVLCRADLATVLQYNDAEFTYGGHPVSCAAALAGLDLLEELRDGLGERVEAFREILADGFPSQQYEVRQMGLIATVTLAEDRLREVWTNRTSASCADRGVFVRCTDLGRRLLLKPPVILPITDLRAGLATVAETSEDVRKGLRRIRSADATRTTGPPLTGCLIRKPLRTNPHADYVDALLRVAAPALHMVTRGSRAQQELTRQLAAIGVRAAPMYAVAGHEAVDYDYIPGRSLHDVLADPTTDSALVNGLTLRHYELVTRAHDHGIVIGDRWPGNAIVTSRADISLIDFELGYSGPLHELALFEETFCVLQTITAIHPTHLTRNDLLARLVAAVSVRHGLERTTATLRRLADFYTHPRRPVHAESGPADVYAGILVLALSRIGADIDIHR